MSSLGWVLALAFVACSFEGSLAVGEKDIFNPLGPVVAGNEGYPSPTPAAPPSLNEDEDSSSGRSYVIGGSDGWNIKEYKGEEFYSV